MKEFFHHFKDLEAKVPVGGIKVRSVYLEQAMMTWMEFEPHRQLPDHQHPHEQITLIVEGELEMTIAGEIKVMRPGDVAVVPSDTPHSARTADQPAIAVDAWAPIREDYK